MMRVSQGANVLIQMSWYPDTHGPSSIQTTEAIPVQIYDQWQSFRFDVQVPNAAIAINVFLRLIPPAQKTVTADFDNLRIIAWAPEGATYNPIYDHALLTGAGELTFAQQVFPGAEQWITTP
jgi:hypothetical protein